MQFHKSQKLIPIGIGSVDDEQSNTQNAAFSIDFNFRKSHKFLPLSFILLKMCMLFVIKVS